MQMQIVAAVRPHSVAWGVGSLPRSRTICLTRMSTTPPLDSLMTRVAQGDAEAFSDLYDQTSSMVYGLALRVVRSEAMAEEITQEVYLQVWRQASGFDAQRGSVKSWMATLAHRRAVDVVRRSQSARDRELKVPADGPEADIAEIAILGDERDRVRAALSSLTDLQFQVIEMAYFGGLTYREVAERLDTPLATVKTRIRDGLTRLRSALGEDDG